MALISSGSRDTEVDQQALMNSMGDFARELNSAVSSPVMRFTGGERVRLLSLVGHIEIGMIISQGEHGLMFKPDGSPNERFLNVCRLLLLSAYTVLGYAGAYKKRPPTKYYWLTG